MGAIFVAGVYGIGKSTLCQQLSKETNIPFFSAGDLISKVNGEQYGANKAVSDKNGNQDILANEVQKLVMAHKEIILAGHCCIFTKTDEIDCLPKDIFHRLSITQMLLLESQTEIILEHLRVRDKRQYTFLQLSQLQHAEHEAAVAIASELICPIYTHTMSFDETDKKCCLYMLKMGVEL